MNPIVRKKELILKQEATFANAVGASVFEKPKVSFWMVLIPILFLYFIYRMQKYKKGRHQFDQEFLITPCRALDLAVETLESGIKPDINRLVQEYGMQNTLEKPYAAWLRALFEYYLDLLKADGDSFDQLVHSAFRNRENYLLILNRLNTSEKDFYIELRSNMSGMEGTGDIITRIETQSQQLRRQLAEKMFI